MERPSAAMLALFPIFGLPGVAARSQGAARLHATRYAAAVSTAARRRLVRSRRLELPRVAPLAPQASASTVPPRPHVREITGRPRGLAKRSRVGKCRKWRIGGLNSFAIEAGVDAALVLLETGPAAL